MTLPPENAAREDRDRRAVERLMPLVYEELRSLAAQQLARERPGHTLQPTALVHEAYLRLVRSPAGGARWGRSDFLAAAASAMRRILIDASRRRRAHKRGGDRHRVPVLEAPAPGPDDDLLALDEALVRLAEHHPEQARLVELRYFGGLTGEEAAAVLGISPSTADRHWVYARAWLRVEVRPS